MTSLREMAKDLSQKIAEIRSGVWNFSTEIEEHQKSKKSAREQYNCCLDTGDQIGMSACLTTIKKASKEVELLSSKFEIFSQKLPALHELHKRMNFAEQKNVKEYETALKVAGEMKKSIDAEINLCTGAAMHLGELQRMIDEKSGSFRSV